MPDILYHIGSNNTHVGLNHSTCKEYDNRPYNNWFCILDSKHLTVYTDKAIKNSSDSNKGANEPGE